MLPTAVREACPRQVGASGCVAQLCGCSQPAVSAPALEEGSTALLPSSAFSRAHAREGSLSTPFPPKSKPSPATASCQKTRLFKATVPFQASPRPLAAPAQQAGCWPHLRFQFFHLCLLACPLHGLHPVLVEVADEELGRDASEEILQWQGLQLSL